MPKNKKPKHGLKPIDSLENDTSLKDTLKEETAQADIIAGENIASAEDALDPCAQPSVGQPPKDEAPEEVALEQAAASENKIITEKEPSEGPKDNIIKSARSYFKITRRKLYIDNPVLIRLLAVCTVLAATTSLKNGLLLCLAAAFVILPLYFVMTLIHNKLPEIYFMPAALLVSGALITPVCMLAAQLVPEVTQSVGIFLPITAINAALMAEFINKKNQLTIVTILRRLASGMGDILGFSLIILVMSVLREMIGNGTLYGRSLPQYAQIKFSFALMPPGAFLLLGLALALVQGIKNRKEKKTEGGK